MSGYTDKPIETIAEDTLGMKGYARGMSNFVLSCRTPMTISIQGEWGSGKTSFMNMIKENVSEKAVPIWFNTWQYSLFGEEGELETSLLHSFLKQLGGEKNRAAEILKFLGSGLKIAAAAAGSYYLGNPENVDAFFKSIEGFSSKKANYVASLESLKSEIQNEINKNLKNSGKERVVVFIDDLDRLRPVRAVELVEVMNVFLGCENCVFILAVDDEIISQGIKGKYGESIDTEKGKNFFDKIIQMPFNLPRAQFDNEEYFGALLEESGLEAEGMIYYCINALDLSVKAENPREIKRIFNRFMFLREMMKEQFRLSEITREDDVILFYTICMQLEFKELYNVFVRNCDAFSWGRLSSVERSLRAAIEGYATDEEMKKMLDVKDEKRLRRIKVFLEKYTNRADFRIPICEFPGDLIYRGAFEFEKQKSDSIIARYGRALKITRISAVDKADDNEENSYERDRMVEIAKYINSSIDEVTGKDFELSIADFQYENELTVPMGANILFSKEDREYVLCYSLYVEAETKKTALQITFHDGAIERAEDFQPRFLEFLQKHNAEWCGPDNCGLTYTIYPENKDEAHNAVICAILEIEEAFKLEI